VIVPTFEDLDSICATVSCEVLRGCAAGMIRSANWI